VVVVAADIGGNDVFRGGGVVVATKIQVFIIFECKKQMRRESSIPNYQDAKKGNHSGYRATKQR
jgi:hypothetical protein